MLDRLKRKYGQTLEDILSYREKTRQESAKGGHACEAAKLQRELETVSGPAPRGRCTEFGPPALHLPFPSISSSRTGPSSPDSQSGVSWL